MPEPLTAPHAERVAAYYDENTEPFYLERWHPEDVHFGLFPEGCDPRDHHAAVKRMTGLIVAPAMIGEGDVVVDAGCGVGGAALDIARGTGATVLGLTVSGVQVELATRRAAELDLSDLVRFERADCSTALPCDNASVDVVVTIEAACHFDDKPGFLRECRRVLRPGGRLAGSDWMATDGLRRSEYDDYLRPVCSAWQLADMETPGAWRNMLESCGFDVHECRDLGETVMPNARILARARLDLLMEVGNGGHPPERARLWQEQYDTLMRAWFDRRFTIGRFFAVAS